MAPASNLLNHTITNLNTNMIVSMLNRVLKQHNPMATGFKIVHIGTDKLLVSISQYILKVQIRTLRFLTASKNLLKSNIRTLRASLVLLI